MIDKNFQDDQETTSNFHSIEEPVYPEYPNPEKGNCDVSSYLFSNQKNHKETPCHFIAEHTSNIVIMISEAFLVTFLNKTATALFKTTKESELGKNIFDLFHNSTLKSPIAVDCFDYSILRFVKLGNIFWRIFPFFCENTLQKNLILIGEYEKNNEEQSIERNLRQVMDCTPGSLYWKDKQGRYLGCNQFMVKTAGLVSHQDIIGKTDADLWPENSEKIRINDNYVMSSGKTVFMEETVKIHSGEVMWFTSVKMPLKNEAGDIIGVIGTSLDITKLKETEKKLMLEKEKVEASDKAKSEFIKNMEHDIRTPFNGILGFSNLLLDKESDPEKKEYLANISSCAKELLDYCDNILDFSRVEHGAIPILEKSFKLRELVNSVIHMETLAAEQKNLTLSVRYGENLPEVLIGDPYRMKRILLNLTSNSIKFTKEGTVNISVDVKNPSDHGREKIIRFIVEDAGIGIPEEKRNIIYERFTRGTPSNQGLYKGQGLGLRIVKQFMTELDGDIHLASEIDKGTTFTLLVPFKLPLTNDIVDEQ